MSPVPNKRPRTSDASNGGDFSLLSNLVQSGAKLTLYKSESGLALQVDDVCIGVPSDLSTRCQLIADAPTGKVLGDAAVFASWLLRQWSAASDASHAPASRSSGRTDASEDSSEHILDMFEMLKACDYLRDEVGLKVYTQHIHSMLIALPVASALSPATLDVYNAAGCPLPLRLLAELPDGLARSIVNRDPLSVIDRLPLDSPAARLACEAYNDWAHRQCRSSKYDAGEFVRDWRAAFPVTWAQSALWTRRNALAARADTQLCVRGAHSHWTESLPGSFQNLREIEVLLLVTQDTYEAPLPQLPLETEKVVLHGIRPSVLQRPATWPTSLRSLIICAVTVHPWDCSVPYVGNYEGRLQLAHLYLPRHLEHLSLNTIVFDVSDSAFPAGLTSLDLLSFVDDCEGGMCGLQDLDVSCLCLPTTLRELTFEGHNLDITKLKGLHLPQQLRILRWTRSTELAAAPTPLPAGLEVFELSTYSASNRKSAVQDLTLPSALRRLQLAEAPGWTTIRELQSLAALTMLDIPGPSAAEPSFMQTLPPDLRDLRLTGLELGDTGWLRQVLLPSTLTKITWERAHLGSETLQGLQWPPQLRVLLIAGPSGQAPWTTGAQQLTGPVLVPDQLPDSLEVLQLRSVRVRMRGFQLPTLLSSLRVHQCVFANVDALAHVGWPRQLEDVVLDGCAFAGEFALELEHLGLPGNATTLRIEGAHFARDCPDALHLPAAVKDLELHRVAFGPGGLQCIVWPPQLTRLYIWGLKLGDRRFRGVALPASVRVLVLDCDSKDTGGPDSMPRWPAALSVLVLLTPHKELLPKICQELGRLPFLQVLLVAECDVECTAVQGWLKRSDVQVLLKDFAWLAPQAYLDICAMECGVAV